VLEIRDLVTSYGPVTALDGVSIDVPKGRITAVLGANGAGKTTLMRTIAGIVRPWSGRVLVDGEDITTADVGARARSGVCLIPEGRGVFGHLSVEDNLGVFAGDGNPPEAVEAAVAAFPALATRLSQPAGTLSGGEQQMLAVSRAFVSAPRLVLVDELSLGLAPLVVDHIFARLAGLRDRGVTLVVVEQFAARALAMADFVYYLRKGTVAHVGRPDAYRDGSLLQQLHLGAVGAAP
jgi:branched-chain amino acid transport system ATP-binding protein